MSLIVISSQKKPWQESESDNIYVTIGSPYAQFFSMPRLNQLPFPPLYSLVTILAQPCSPWKQNKRSEKKPSIKRRFLLNGERELSHDQRSRWAGKQRDTNPKLPPRVPDDPVLCPIVHHTPTSDRHDVIGQRQGVKLWEQTSRIFLQALSGHQSTTERQSEGYLKSLTFTISTVVFSVSTDALLNLSQC